VLVVNTPPVRAASPPVRRLEAIHKAMQSGAGGAGVPTTSLAQTPGTDGEIAGFCQKNYGVSFR
jgi:glutathione peroxidase-family protein